MDALSTQEVHWGAPQTQQAGGTAQLPVGGAGVWREERWTRPGRVDGCSGHIDRLRPWGEGAIDSVSGKKNQYYKTANTFDKRRGNILRKSKFRGHPGVAEMYKHKMTYFKGHGEQLPVKQASLT